MSNRISVRNESWQSLQSIFRARLRKRYCTTLTKVKIRQACKRSDLSWNRPSKGVINCKLCGVRKKMEVVSKVVSSIDER